MHLEELIEWPLIVMHDDHGVRRMFDEAIAREGLAYRAAHVARTPNVAQALAAAGRGVCVVSDDSRFGLRELPILVGGVRAEHHALRRLGPDPLRGGDDPELRRTAEDVHPEPVQAELGAAPPDA